MKAYIFIIIIDIVAISVFLGFLIGGVREKS